MDAGVDGGFGGENGVGRLGRGALWGVAESFSGDLAVSARGCAEIAQWCAVIEVIPRSYEGTRCGLRQSHECTRINTNCA
jgi:hypothetical protein